MRHIIINKLEKQIESFDSNAVFIAKDFLEIADYETVRRALNRLADDGIIQKILPLTS